MKKRRSVLVIDDDDVAQGAVASLLEKAGFSVHVLDSPIGATRAIRDQKIDIVVVDLNMPAMRGDAFARMFRKSPLFANIPLVVVSSGQRGSSTICDDRISSTGSSRKEICPSSCRSSRS
jgi:CheY-like chemotaxis protein